MAGAALLPIAVGVIAYLWISAAPAQSNIVLGFGISAIAAVGYQVFVGATGIVSFGHVTFSAIGAYVAGILTVPVVLKRVVLPDLPAWLAHREVGLLVSVLVAAVAAAVVAAVAGVVLLRLSGTAASISTLALLVIANEILRNATRFTRGTQTFYGVPARAHAIGVFAMLTVTVVIAVAFKTSRVALRARAVRDDALAAETSGLGLVRSRLAPWVLSAAITGASGALLAQELTAFSPKVFFIAASVPIVIMVVLGGTNSVTGAVMGAVILTAVQELLRRVEAGNVFGLHVPSVTGIADIAFGVILILVLRLRPAGVMGGSDPELVGTRRTR